MRLLRSLSYFDFFSGCWACFLSGAFTNLTVPPLSFFITNSTSSSVFKTIDRTTISITVAIIAIRNFQIIASWGWNIRSIDSIITSRQMSAVAIENAEIIAA